MSDDDVHMSVIVPCGISFETYTSGAFPELDLKISRFVKVRLKIARLTAVRPVRRLLQQLTPISVQDLRSF